MGVFGKSFFSFPPSDPEEPGFAQDSNRSLREAHSTGKGITELLSSYDQETIISMDGKKYQVMGQREGSDTGGIWWAPTLDLKEMTLQIAPGAITAPWDDRDETATDPAIGSQYFAPKENYHFYTMTVPDQTLTAGKNYFFITAFFTERKFWEHDEGNPFAVVGTGDPPNTMPWDEGEPGVVILFRENIVWQYHTKEIDDFAILKSTEEIKNDERQNCDTLLLQHQMLGWYEIENDKVKDHYWRTNHVIDFRPAISNLSMIVSSTDTGEAMQPTSPPGPC